MIAPAYQRAVALLAGELERRLEQFTYSRALLVKPPGRCGHLLRVGRRSAPRRRTKGKPRWVPPKLYHQPASVIYSYATNDDK
jgi:hypothetical protein